MLLSDNFIEKIAKFAEKASQIEEDHYNLYDVKRGLRNKDATGVLAGLTRVGTSIGFAVEENTIIPKHGKLFYRNLDVTGLVKGFQKEGRHGFEETAFLLLTGKLPAKAELKAFEQHLAERRKLPSLFIRTEFLKMPSKDIMNMLGRSVLALYALDSNPDDISVENLMRQSIELIAKFPTIIVYAYNTQKKRKLIPPKKNLSTSENFLQMLNGSFSELDAKILDLILVLHAEHGGGNNSSFTMRVVSSSRTDTYSAVASALGSLKGPLHGGANVKAREMMEEIAKNVKDWSDEEEIKEYLLKIFKGEAFDRSGKIYGFGHPVYTLSDPRQVILKGQSLELAREKNRTDEFNLYEKVELLVPKMFQQHKGGKVICANVDFYSGFVYSCMNIPKETFTPLFAMARIAGWCAHRMEELLGAKRLIRPTYKSITDETGYVDMKRR